MEATPKSSAASPDRTFVISRMFDAPRELVFRAWTEETHRPRWWGPRGFTVLSYDADIRVGGRFRVHARSPAGTEHWAAGVYREIAEPERLAFTTAWLEPDGTPKNETLVTLTFEDRNGKTELTLHQAAFESMNARDLHHGGWSSSLDCLAEYLATIR